jgi:ribosomal protein L20A (L18A)
MKRMLKVIAILLVVVASIFVAGCASKTTTTLKNTQGTLEQVTPVAIPQPAMQTQVSEAQVAGLFIEFEDGTTESEVKAIVKAVLDNYNMTVNTIDYNYSIMPSRYYIKVDKAKIMDIRDELRKEKIWTDPAIADLKKGNYYIITVPEQIIHDKNFLMILGKNNLQVKKSVLCYIYFGGGYKNGILVEDATRITDEIKANKKVLTVTPDMPVYGLLIEFEDGTYIRQVDIRF